MSISTIGVILGIGVVLEITNAIVNLIWYKIMMKSVMKEVTEAYKDIM